MNSFPTPESSPVIIESDVSNKSKDSKNERKKKSPLKNERKKLSKSLSPGTSVNGKRKTLFPKVVLPLFPKITNKVSVHILFMPFFLGENFRFFQKLNFFSIVSCFFFGKFLLVFALFFFLLRGYYFPLLVRNYFHVRN